MRVAIAFLVAAAVQLPAQAEHFYRAGLAYDEGKIYVLAASANTPKRPFPQGYVRSHPTRELSYVGDEIVYFWDYLRWGNARNDPGIK